MMGFVGPLRRLALSVFYRSGRRGAQGNFPRPLAGEGGAQPKAGRVRARGVTDGGFNRLSDLIDSDPNSLRENPSAVEIRNGVRVDLLRVDLLIKSFRFPWASTRGWS
jgi:hypothetical protein